MHAFVRTVAAFAFVWAAAPSQALTLAPYSAAALAQAQNVGQPVALHFHASWCPTCRAQTKSFEALQAEPGLDFTVLVADYDKERALKQALKVQSQSTLIVYRGKQERARLIGETAPEPLRAALKTAN